MVFVLNHTLRTAKRWALARSWYMFHHKYALHITLICIGEMQYSDWCRMNWLEVLNVLINTCLRVELPLFLISNQRCNGIVCLICKWHVIGQPCDWKHTLLGIWLFFFFLNDFLEYGFCIFCMIEPYGGFECSFVLVSIFISDHETNVMTEHVLWHLELPLCLTSLHCSFTFKLFTKKLKSISSSFFPMLVCIARLFVWILVWSWNSLKYAINKEFK